MTMKRLLAAALLLAACRSTKAPPAPQPGPVRPQPQPAAAVSAANLVDHEGDSVETAVAVPSDASDGGVPFENEWIFKRFGKFRRYAGGTGTLNGRRYDVVKVELPGGEKKQVYFDITETGTAGSRRSRRMSSRAGARELGGGRRTSTHSARRPFHQIPRDARDDKPRPRGRGSRRSFASLRMTLRVT